MKPLPRVRATVCLAAVAGIFLFRGLAEAALEYWVVDLGTLGGAGSEALGLNDRSQVVGWAKDVNGRTQAFLWEHGTLTGLGFLTNRWSNSVATAINNHGEITGYSSITATNEHAFLVHSNQLTDIGTLGGANSRGFDINDLGEIAGRADRPSNTIPQAFLWRTNHMIWIPTYLYENTNQYPTALHECEARGISMKSQVCGFTFYQPADAYGEDWGFVWSDLNTNGTDEYYEMKVLGNMGTSNTWGSSSGAFGMNDIDQAVGWTYVSSVRSPYHAFRVTSSNGIWKIPQPEPNGAATSTNSLMIDLGSLAGTNGNSYANAINNHSWVVGLSSSSSGTNQAFLWREGVMTNLNDLIPPGSGWVLTNATAINDHGEIAGSGRYLGQPRAFLLQQDGRIIRLAPLRETNTWVYTNELLEVVTQTTVTVTSHEVQWAGVWDGNPYTSHVFTVEACDTLRPPAPWSPVAPTSQWPILENFWTDTNYPAASTRFFRVRAELPP